MHTRASDASLNTLHSTKAKPREFPVALSMHTRASDASLNTLPKLSLSVFHERFLIMRSLVGVSLSKFPPPPPPPPRPRPRPPDPNPPRPPRPPRSRPPRPGVVGLASASLQRRLRPSNSAPVNAIHFSLSSLLLKSAYPNPLDS